MPSITIAAGRLTLAAVFISPVVLLRYRSELYALSRRDLGAAMFAGLLNGLHFITISMALEYTSVVLAQVIVGTSPIWVALLEVTILRANFRRGLWIGLTLVITGGILIAFGASQSQTGSDPILGLFLAVISSVTVAGYLFFGRVMRRHISIMPYLWLVYIGGGITGLAAAFATQTSIVGYNGEAYFWLLMVTLVPQLIGHSGMNYAVGYISATLISINGQIIVATAGVLAFIIFGEVPAALELAGSSVIVGGVIMAILAQTRSRRKRQT